MNKAYQFRFQTGQKSWNSVGFFGFWFDTAILRITTLHNGKQQDNYKNATLSIMTFSIKTEVCYAKCHFYIVSFMLSVTNMPPVLNVINAECCGTLGLVLHIFCFVQGQCPLKVGSSRRPWNWSMESSLLLEVYPSPVFKCLTWQKIQIFTSQPCHSVNYNKVLYKV